MLTLAGQRGFSKIRYGVTEMTVNLVTGHCWTRITLEEFRTPAPMSSLSPYWVVTQSALGYANGSADV